MIEVGRNVDSQSHKVFSLWWLFYRPTQRKEQKCHISNIKEKINTISVGIEKQKNHPFLVVLVTEEEKIKEEILISVFNMTSSTIKFLKEPNHFIKLDENPNPESDSETYVEKRLVKNQPSKYFTRPIRKWKLSSEDVIKIDVLLGKNKKI